MKRALSIAGFGDAAAGWNWIVPFWDDVTTNWAYYSTVRGKLLARAPGPHWGRIVAAARMNIGARMMRPDVLVSVGPVNSFYVEALGQRFRRRTPHLAWAFNFTALPEGRHRAAMGRGLRAVERFVVFSTMERELYAAHFDLPIDRFHFTPWGVAPPLEQPRPRTIAAPYVAALGGEARDYATFCEAARRLPHIRFVAIVRAHSLDGQDVPSNVDVRINLPWDDAWSLVAHAEAAVIPLQTSETPNGHVTLVGGMQLGKAQVVTDSRGVADYAKDGETALLIPPRDGAAMARAIERLLDEPALRSAIGAQARAFAHEHCSERSTVAFAREQVRAMVGM